MYLKRLELHGFKSFAQSTALEFQRGVSAVVGPNGSGKSNIADALRFVLGEQSMKNIRSKKGEDLIFSGSATKPRMSMAIVALHFDNEDKSFPLEFQTVVIKRKIFRDGENHYYINDAQVRLKDLMELIAKAHIGLKGYAVISQGMGDAVLNASPKERKDVIFEALGLKEFQMKKTEAVLKLAQTQINLEKAQSVVREIEPHIRFLKRQAEKLDERNNLEQKLKQLENQFLHKRVLGIDNALAKHKKEAEEKSGILSATRAEMSEIQKDIESEDGKISTDFSNLPNLEQSLFQMESARNSLEREIGRMEGMISVSAAVYIPKFQPVNVEYVREKLDYLCGLLDEILKESDASLAFQKMRGFAGHFKKVSEEVRSNKVLIEAAQKEEPKPEAVNLKVEREALLARLKEYDVKIANVKEEMKSINVSYHKEKENIFELKNKKREKELQAASLEEKLYELNKSIENLSKEREILYKEKEMLEQRGALFAVTDVDSLMSINDEDARREIEKLKLKLENIDLIDDNIKTEYEATQKRFDFLTKESGDLENAIKSLYQVIAELDQTISSRFKEAFKKINDNFCHYFKILFDGGSAKLEITQEEKSEEDGSYNKDVDYGVDIDVILPGKKLSGLAALSGGERALTSLALLFALISTSPPPFLVLDEIDAPLDESNSMRFSKILNELKKHTQFIVVTHNRETMRQSDVLYGVTMQEDGVSKLLSLKFDPVRSS